MGNDLNVLELSKEVSLLHVTVVDKGHAQLF